MTNPAPDPSGETAGAVAPRLDPGDLAVWGGFLEVHTRLMRLLDADLVAIHGMALVEYEVLFKLSTAGGQLRMSDLAQVAMLSRSGLTRIVGVLEAQRLVRRVSPPGDGRVLIATLTPAGQARLAAAIERVGGPEAVLEALHPIEHDLLVDAVRLIAQGAVRLDPANPRRVVISR